MNYTISNNNLTVTVATKGGELQSVKTADGHEYLWQGNPEIWRGRAYNLFPIIGRMYNGKYVTYGKEYSIPMHGLVRQSELSIEQCTEQNLALCLNDSELTLSSYPFRFKYTVEYSLDGNSLIITHTVFNKDDKTMYFGIGGHPGFFVPMESGKSFEDYYITFPNGGNIKQCIMDDNVYFTGLTPDYALTNGRMYLKHEMFQHDAVVLLNTGGTAVIACDGGKRSVTMHYPNTKYIGVWHIAKPCPPYICLEPWTMLPASVNGMDELESKPDIIALESGKTFSLSWRIDVK